jgi:hypothetical protein
MRKYIRIGVDIAKNSFQVHALESEDCSPSHRRLTTIGVGIHLGDLVEEAGPAEKSFLLKTKRT